MCGTAEASVKLSSIEHVMLFTTRPLQSEFCAVFIVIYVKVHLRASFFKEIEYVLLLI